MDYQKLLPVLALTLGLTAGAAESMASTVPVLPQGLSEAAQQATAPDAATLFTMNEVNGSGVLLAREKGCLASKGCLGVCAGRKPLHHDSDKAGTSTCASKGGNIVSGDKAGSTSCSGAKAGGSACGSKAGDKSCSGDK